ncbi:UDP-glucose 4-epimerase [Variovorax boronicumulans]|uniref:UDP-glucose 4-epimerase n=1 Tax=Variovorax boronicumulans TaxID=436515 RepID=A0AAW8DUS0_9BURK|nr:UDP-glucose 4-epimerase GalE [Variovorax boronicumulans]MDP9877997.1 UDP-glucose 4-epimerase [Variovorax boronicumulans]MDP9923280.1 UDP-glucose 4-epimerase [Variovorax boronicumulans]
MILVTGGAGYIGSHTCVALAAAGLDYALLDNFSNSERTVPVRLAAITGYEAALFEGDVRDETLLRDIFDSHRITGVLHFAGLKAVGESSLKPLDYFSNNVIGSLSVVQAMTHAGCKRLVFSSSATVYGDGRPMPLAEGAPCAATNPYGRSKLMVEEMLGDLERSDASWQIARLRYFNPVGAHESGLIGESPKGVPNNLMPYVAQVAAGVRASLSVFGGDYPTPDGTAMRDFIHVMDLAESHVAALMKLQCSGGGLVLNLGTGRGTSVLGMIGAFQRASGRRIPFQIVNRRPGDVANCYADVSRAAQLLGWRAKRTIDDMCRDAWRWQMGQAQ